MFGSVLDTVTVNVTMSPSSMVVVVVVLDNSKSTVEVKASNPS